MSKLIVLQKKMLGKKLVIRYPKKGDEHFMHEYINTLSREKTYIRFQGELLSLKEEKKYLDGQLEKIKKNKAVQLLVFLNSKLVGISEITLKDKIEKHIGVLGITVAKEFRGKGIGKLLMDNIIDESKKNLAELKIIILEVFDNNPIAISIYENFGFIKYGKLPKGICYKNKYIDSILMFKTV